MRFFFGRARGPSSRSELLADAAFCALFLVFVSHTFLELTSVLRFRQPEKVRGPLYLTLAQSALVYDRPGFFQGKIAHVRYPGRETVLGERDVRRLVSYSESLLFTHSGIGAASSATNAAWLRLFFCDLRVQDGPLPPAVDTPLSVDWTIKDPFSTRESLIQSVSCRG